MARATLALFLACLLTPGMLFAQDPAAVTAIDQAFLRLDTNKDGVISRGEADDSVILSSYFSDADTDADNAIDRVEFGAFQAFISGTPGGGGLVGAPATPESAPSATGDGTTGAPAGTAPPAMGSPGVAPPTTVAPGALQPFATPGQTPSPFPTPGQAPPPFTGTAPGTAPGTGAPALGTPGATPPTTSAPGATPPTTSAPGATPPTTSSPGGTPPTTSGPGGAPRTFSAPGSTPPTTSSPGTASP
ncbi:MAG: hypothetical protein M0R77_17260 [Gammaproteobacteria bacterium]|nr:hypothetical protein [Gammaproteobacteria bacterium]